MLRSLIVLKLPALFFPMFIFVNGIFFCFWPSRLVPRQFNSYGSRRGNDAVMARGTFANIRLVNKFIGKAGPKTIHIPSNEQVKSVRCFTKVLWRIGWWSDRPRPLTASGLSIYVFRSHIAPNHWLQMYIYLDGCFWCCREISFRRSFVNHLGWEGLWLWFIAWLGR